MKRARVELNIFSGRPNPGWEIPFDLAMELYTTSIIFPEARTKEFFEGLGYRGFVVVIEQDQGEKVMFTAFSDLIKIEKGREKQYKRDEKKIIENQLLKSARDKIDAPLFRTIENEIAKHK